MNKLFCCCVIDLTGPFPAHPWLGRTLCTGGALLKANPSHPQHQFLTFITNSPEIWDHLTTSCTWRDPRSRKTAPAAGRSWLSCSLEARAAPLMPCQWWPPVRKAGMSHSTGTRNSPVWIAAFRSSYGGFLPALPSPFVHSNPAKGKQIYPADMGRVCQAFSGFALKLRQEGVKGLRDHLGRAP